MENNWLKWWLLQWFGVRSLRRGRSEAERGRYFMVKRGVSEMVKEAIGLLNDKGGYVYLVDAESRIRWAGSAEATDAERESLVRGVKRLALEAKTPKEQRLKEIENREQLEDVVAEVVGDLDLGAPQGEKKAAAAA